MEFRHPKTLYLRSYPNRHRRSGEWLVCDRDNPDEVRNVDVSTQYNSKGWEIPNEPVTGMTIKGLVSKHNKTSFVIEDPRKFKLRVPAETFWASVGRDFHLIGSVIQNPCVWALTANKNYPVPLSISSESYHKSVVSSHLRGMDRISLRDIKRGNIVTLRNGKTVEYLGLFRTASLFSVSQKPDLSHIQIGEISKRYLYVEHRGRERYLISNSSLDAVEIQDDNELSLIESQNLAYSIPVRHRDWHLRHRVYMAPEKFEKDDLVLTLRSINRDDLDLRMRPFVLIPQTGDFYDITDWRVSTVPYRGSASLMDSVRFLPVRVKASKRSHDIYIRRDAFFIDRPLPQGCPLYILEVSLGGKYAQPLSGHLPR